MATIIKEGESPINKDNLIAFGKVTGLVSGGIIGAHIAVKMLGKTKPELANSPAVNGAIAAGGIIGAMKMKNPALKLLFLGAGVYGSIKLANSLVKEVSTPGNSGAAGLSGLIPENLKARIRDFLPSLGSLDADPLMYGADEDVNGINLDDVVSGDGFTPYTDVSNGIGSLNLL